MIPLKTSFSRASTSSAVSSGAAGGALVNERGELVGIVMMDEGGAASLSAADHLHNFGQTDLAMVTEKVGGGTSNNTGSDKQTYYKLSVYGKEGDCPFEMAKSLYDGGSMHGDLALIESICSAKRGIRPCGHATP